MGRETEKRSVTFSSGGKSFKKDVEFFAWEKLDYVDRLKKEFNI
jgi:S-adenosylmethionine synthetase